MTAGDMAAGDETGEETPAVPPGAGIEVLREAELTIIGRIPTASNTTLVCDAVSAVGEIRCVYKPVRGEAPLWDFPHGTLAGREVASFLISEALGWGVIPHTVFRDGPVGPGMVQRWIDTPDEVDGLDLVDLCDAEAIPDGYRAVLEAIGPRGEPVVLVHAVDPALLRMAVLDVVLNNADRKGGHVLAGADGAIYGVDHGICLHVDDKLRTVLWGWAGQPVPDALADDLATLADRLDTAGDPLTAELSQHITGDEIVALALRAEDLATTRRMPRPPMHRPIPWPPF